MRGGRAGSRPGAGRDGHAAATLRGRPASGRPDEAAARDAYVRALERLLEVGQVRAERRVAEVGGRAVHYLEAGRGPVVVLLQGAGGGAGNWFRLIPELATRFRVLVPELPGFGLSDPIDPEPPLGARVADGMLAWLGGLGVERCAVVATSFGGLAALRMAQRAPETVRRLVLLDAAGLGRRMPFLVRLAGLPLLGGWVLRPTRRGTAWAFRTLMTADRSELGGEVGAALVEYLWRAEAARPLDALVRGYRLFCGLFGQREVLSDAELAALRLPVLVVWGGRDRFLPVRHGRRAAARIPDAALHVIPRAGHSPNWEAPRPLLDLVIPFLAAERARPAT